MREISDCIIFALKKKDKTFIKYKVELKISQLVNVKSTLLKLTKVEAENTSLISRGDSLRPNTSRSSWLSPSRHFAFGFYPQGNGFAVGIWLVDNPDNITVVWTANRDDPPLLSNSTIEFTKDGELLLRTGQDEDQSNTIAKLYYEKGVSALMNDSGNFVIYNNNSEVIWESFNHPTDTLLGGQSMWNYLASSKSTSDHSRGQFYLGLDNTRSPVNLVAYPANHTDAGVPQEIYWEIKTQESIFDRPRLNLTGGVLQLTTGNLTLQVIANTSYKSVMNETLIYRATLDADGILRLYLHHFKMDGSSKVTHEWSALQNHCEVKGFCGFNSFCDSNGNGSDCLCFDGFHYINPRMRSMGCSRNFFDDQGCYRNDPALFYNITNMEKTKLGGVPYSLLSVNKENCRKSCLEDCYCGAAYHANGKCGKVRLPLMFGRKGENESGTVFIKWSSKNGSLSFPPPLPPQVPSEPSLVVVESKKDLIRNLGVSLGFITFVCFLIAICSYLAYKVRVNKYKRLPANSKLGLKQGFTALKSFSYNELVQATGGFKEKLTTGSSGAVYKGTINEGKKTIVVKRLENLGEEEERKFRAEMAAVRQTHHKNLVRLLGFCIEGSKKLLIYEYMSKGSLADLLFNEEKRPVWKERVRIALDVAKGIFYLHEECEVQIVHCNIRPKNILIDDSGTAKISNFGSANLLMPIQTETISEVKGTRGYMAPEWQKNALVSIKSDVYSFGITLLEIICCRSNIEVNVAMADEVLLSTWVYKCFIAGTLDKLVQEEEVDMKSLERMVKVGLLCVQDDQTLRPSMKSVILMLEGTMDVTLPPFATTSAST